MDSKQGLEVSLAQCKPDTHTHTHLGTETHTQCHTCMEAAVNDRHTSQFSMHAVVNDNVMSAHSSLCPSRSRQQTWGTVTRGWWRSQQPACRIRRSRRKPSPASAPPTQQGIGAEALLQLRQRTASAAALVEHRRSASAGEYGDLRERLGRTAHRQSGPARCAGRRDRRRRASRRHRQAGGSGGVIQVAEVVERDPVAAGELPEFGTNALGQRLRAQAMRSASPT